MQKTTAPLLSDSLRKCLLQVLCKFEFGKYQFGKYLSAIALHLKIFKRSHLID